MGGYNSGRHGWRGVIEQRRRLDVRRFQQYNLLNKPGSAGIWRWSQDGETTGTVGYLVRDDTLELRYTASDEDGSQDIRYWIGVERGACRYGGHRFYWRCPFCHRRCEVLAMAHAGREWACTRCLRLRYVSQGLAPADRMQRRADAIYDRLGGSDAEGMVYKPKWMRWRTFNRLMEQADYFAGESDAAFALRAMRMMKLLPAGWR